MDHGSRLCVPGTWPAPDAADRAPDRLAFTNGPPTGADDSQRVFLPERQCRGLGLPPPCQQRSARRVAAKIEWHRGEPFPRIGIVITNSRLPAGKVIKVYNGRAEIENRSKEGKNTLRWDKTSCQRFEANQARLKMGLLAYNLLHMIRQFYVWGEEVKRSMDWLIKRLIKVGARVSYHARRWYVHVASAFPLAHHYRAVLAWGS